MNLRRILYYPLIIILAATITVLESSILYSSNHYRTKMTIIFAELQTYVLYGWIFFIPIIFLIYDSTFFKRVIRIPTLLSPILIELIYYYIIIKNPTEENYYKINAGYLHYYSYSVDILFSTILTSLLSIIGFEIIVKKSSPTRCTL